MNSSFHPTPAPALGPMQLTQIYHLDDHGPVQAGLCGQVAKKPGITAVGRVVHCVPASPHVQDRQAKLLASYQGSQG